MKLNVWFLHIVSLGTVNHGTDIFCLIVYKDPANTKV